jgi:hypothetical protein
MRSEAWKDAAHSREKPYQSGIKQFATRQGGFVIAAHLSCAIPFSIY